MSDKPNYLAPRMSELRAMGYQPNDVSPAARTSVLNSLVYIGSPIGRYAEWYINHYGNFRQPALKAVTVLAYGLDNMPEFGNSLEGVANDMLHKIIREIMSKWRLANPTVKTKRIKNNAVTVQRLLDACDMLRGEAEDQIRRKGGKVVKEKWRSKREVKHRGISNGGCYRIELYDRYYD